MNRKTNVTILVAFLRGSRIIGNSQTNSLPVGLNLPKDRKLMSDATKGHIVYMGRPTFESFPEAFRPLPERNNIILTTNKDYEPFPTNDDTCVCHTLEETVRFADAIATEDNKEIFCFGGGNIYQQTLTHPLVFVKKIIATIIDGDDLTGDVTFPEIDATLFKEVSRVHYEKQGKNTHSFDLVTYEHI
ncbi:MAG: dihydrofolate reductase [Patescibacteria group bacterium]